MLEGTILPTGHTVSCGVAARLIQHLRKERSWKTPFTRAQYANAEISCTADEQLCRDAEFNLLMQAGTIVRMERFNVEELRGVLEQLVADGSCFRTAPASSTMGRVMRHLTRCFRLRGEPG